MNRPIHEREACGGVCRAAFTLVELLATFVIVAILATLSYQGILQMRAVAQGSHCANSLRQLGMATSLYLGDHRDRMFYYKATALGGCLWYFGYESGASLNSLEGDRIVDVTQSPLYPYVKQVGGVEECPAFPYDQAIWKPKYRGASWGYGMNIYLSNVSTLTVPHPAQIILFADCAQVNNFQAPASVTHPMLEEFYMIDSTDPTIHFRHEGAANILFLDGHVEKFTMYPGTQDLRLPAANVGRITPTYPVADSMKYLQ